MSGAAETYDFFISRAGADKALAGRIADIVREAGLTPFYQDEHFGHSDFMRMMEHGFENAAKLIVLLSEDYQKSEHCRKEYNTFLAGDPGNLKKRVIVFRVSNCAPSGNLATLAYTDLVPVLNNCGALQQAVREVVREALGIDKRTPGGISDMLARAGRQILHPNIRAVKGFTGREDLLAALGQKLAAKGAVAIRNATQTTLAMRGLGGVGKTVLAQQFAWLNRERYFGVWWLRAETAETLIDDLAALGSRFIPGLGDMKPEDAALTTADQLAQMRTEKPWLLVYDNAVDAALVRRFAPAANADVLVTTRRTDWLGEADDELEVDVFDRATAVDYLRRHARHADAKAAGRLAHALQDLPLALSHARAYCWERNWDFDTYAARLAELLAAQGPGAHPVTATFGLAIENAAKECAAAERLMALLAFFAPDEIPLWLIPEDAMPEKEREDALAALARVSLATYGKSSDGAPAVSVHRLVQAAMRARLRASARFDEMAALAIRLLYDAYDFFSGTLGTMLRRAAWIAHAAAAIPHAPNSGDAAWHTLWTLYQMGDFRVMRGDLSGALDAYESGAKIAADVARSQPGNAGWQRDLSVSYIKVGDVLAAQGNLPEALKSFRDSLAIGDRLAKADPGNAEWQRDLSVSYDKVGDVLVAQGNLPEALKSFRDSLAIAGRLAKSDPGNAGWQRDLSVSYIKVGGVLVAQGNLPEALKSFRDSLAIRDRLAKADPGNAGWQRDVAVSHAKLADIYRRQGETALAKDALGTGKAIMERMTKLSPDNAEWKRDLAWFEAQIAALDGAEAPPAAGPRGEKKRGFWARAFGRKG
ncbi:MAG: TIR domain-containing protein [Rhodomicrobium sp.]